LTIDVEEVERNELATLHGAADDTLKARLALQCVTVGGALVSIAGALPPSSIVVNRTIGLGLSGPEDPETIRRVVALYRQAGVARYFVHVHPDAQPPGIRDWLLEAGLEKARGWMKFTRGRDAPPPAATDLTIRPADTADAPAFGRIVADAFDLGSDAVDWMARVVDTEGWRIYMTFDGDEPAGTGGLYVRDGIGFCDFGATAPAFRRRGSQSALLRRRIMDAIDMGCRMIVTETGEEVEGDPQHSYKNILRMGFEEAYVRENYAPPR
jgi:GNAT superfamily N-acetyltransferase